MPIATGFSPAARFLVVAGAIVVVIAGLRAAAPLVAAFLLSVFIAVIAAPPMFYMVRRGFPSWVAMLIVSFMVAAIGAIVLAVVSDSITGFTANLPGYQDQLKMLSEQLRDTLAGQGIALPAQSLATYLDAGKALKMAGTLLGGLGGTLANAMLILFTVVFLLFEAQSLPTKLRAALRTPDQTMAQLDKVFDNINRYMRLKSLMSLLTGFLIWLWLWALGIDFPMLWAVVAFLLNYVPNIGSIIAAVPTLLLALVQLGPTAALWTAVGYLVVNTLVGNVIEPRLMGRGLGLSSLIVFLSLIFWGWVLGPVGMFLSVPLTMALKIALDANPQTRPIGIMLGPEIQGRAAKAPAEKEISRG